VSVTVVSEVTADAWTAKVDVLLLGATLVLAGTCTAGLLLVNVTEVPVLGAVTSSVTVAVVDAPDETWASATDKLVTFGAPVGGVDGLTVTVAVWLIPLCLAVTVTVLFVVTDFDVAVNVLVVAPAGTVTEVGTVRALESLEVNVTVIVDDGAGLTRTVPVAV
jgi:hypothetical protein